MARGANESKSDPLAFVDASLAERTRHAGESHRLLKSDCLAALASLPAASVDLIFADPPYNLSNGGTTCASGKRVAVHKGAWDASAGVNADHDFNLQWLAACRRVLKPSGTIWVSGTQHVIFSLGFAMQTLGYHLLNTVTWFKPNASPNLACRFFTHSTELVLWAAPARGKPLPHTFHYRDMKAENGGKQMRDLWQVPEAEGGQVVWSLPTPPKSEKAVGRHPTQKPLSLLTRILRAASNPGDVVLDPFSGSGTTGVAALQLGRRYIGIDLDVNYLDLAQRRIEAIGVVPAAPIAIVQSTSARRPAKRKLPGSKTTKLVAKSVTTIASKTAKRVASVSKNSKHAASTALARKTLAQRRSKARRRKTG